MQDPTEFRKRFLLYKEGKMPYENGRPKAIQKVDESNADFAKRLKSNWRLEIWDWERSGKSVTHKIADTDNIVYPNVQTTKGGGLIDFTHPIWKGNVDPYRRAIKNNDYVPMDSEQDAIWFGPNYKGYYPGFKNGKSVSEIYNAGLPRYAEGTELPIEQMMPYILAVENPTKQGLVNGVWRPPTDSSKWDTHAIGGGLDIREENNPIVYNYLKSKGRLNNPYLTVSEEEMLRKQTFEKTTLPALRKMYGKYKDKISEKGYARLAGMKWQGHPYLMAITPDSITGKAFLNAVASGDRDLDSVFDAYYKYPANAKRYGARINADVNYWKNYSTPSNVEPKSELVQLLEQLDKEKFLPWSNYHSPDYSLSNPAPSTISSWNNPTSPAFNTSGLYTRRATNNINNVVQDILFNDKDVLDALMDNLSKNVFGGKRLGFKNGKLPGYEDGNVPQEKNQSYKIIHPAYNEDDRIENDWKTLIQWADKWLQSRANQMANNIDTYSEQPYRGSSADAFHVSPIPILDIWDRYRLYNARKIAKELIDHAKNVPRYDLRIDWQYNKAKDNSYALDDFLQKPYGTQGSYYPSTYKNNFKDEEIFVAPYGAVWDNSVPLHEFMHAATSDYQILQAEIDKIFGGYTKSIGRKYNDKYLDDSNEVYSRLMQFRFDNNLSPNKKVTKRDINNWRKSKSIKDHKLLNRYDDDILVKLFNDVAQNDTGYKNLFMASNGKLPGYKDGKSPIHINPANRGKFNATKKRTGKTTEQLAHSSNPLTRKRAIFALNARKWHH